MSVLIKGMKMPEDCPKCPLSHWNKLDQLTGCELVRRYVPESESSYWQSDKRPEWCPLVGLPDHGNLVDMDEFSRAMYHEAFEVDSALQKWESGCWIRYKMFERLRDSAPVIIPEERSEE